MHLKHSLDGTVEMASAQLMEEVAAPPDAGSPVPTPGPAATSAADAASTADGDAKAADEPATTDYGEKMDTSADAKSEGDAAAPAPDAAKDAAEPAAPTPPPKKKFRKVALSIDAKGITLSKKEMNEAIESEAKLQQADRIVVETAAKKNEVEAYIYKMRDEVLGRARDVWRVCVLFSFCLVLSAYMRACRGFVTRCRSECTPPLPPSSLSVARWPRPRLLCGRVWCSASRWGDRDDDDGMMAWRAQVIGDLREYVNDADKSSFEAALTDAETWLYEGDGWDTTKGRYVEKLQDLEAYGKPIVWRKHEAEERPAAVKALKDKIRDYISFANSSDDKYAHITQEDRGKVRTVCDEAEAWVNDLLGKQGDVPLTADPAFKATDVATRQKALIATCKPIKATPPPPPPASEPLEKEEEDAKAADAKPDDAKAAEDPAAEKSEGGDDAATAAAEGKEGEPMDTDGGKEGDGAPASE